MTQANEAKKELLTLLQSVNDMLMSIAEETGRNPGSSPPEELREALSSVRKSLDKILDS